MNSTSQQDREQSFDYKQIVIKALQYWYLFLIAAAIGAGYAYYKVRYSVPVYQVDARIMVKDEYTSWGQEYFLPGMELVSTRNRLVNEVGAIRSFTLMRKVVEQLPDFKVTYYDVGNIKSTELYRNTPFVVEYDTLLNNALLSRSFYIEILSDELFSLGTKRNGDFKGQEHKFNVPFNINDNLINIKLKVPYDQSGFKDKMYGFTINDLDGLAINYQGGLGVDLEEKESSILKISRTGTQIYKEMDFINKFLDVYINEGLEKNNQIASNVMRFVDDQIHKILDSLIVAEGRMEYFKSRSNMEKIDLDGEKLIPEITRLEKSKIDLQFNINYYIQLIDYIKNNDDAKGLIVPAFIDQSNVLYSLLQKLLELYTSKMKLKYDVTTTNDSWKRLNDEIFVSKQIFIENLNAIRNKAEIDLERVKKEISFIEHKMLAAPIAERAYYNIQRDYRLNNDLYTYLLKKRAEASIAKGSNVPKAQVLDWATPYRISSVGPDSSKIYTTNIVIALIIAGLLAFLMEYFNEKITDKNDLKKATKIPLLAIVGHNTDKDELVVLNNAKSVISESFRALRTNIYYMAGGRDKFCILVTSSISNEGKTFCSLNLASVFSILGKKTLIMGGDLRKPMIYQDFGLKNEIGLSSILIERATLDEVIQPTGFENIDIISAGPVPPNPSELIGNDKMKLLMDELKDRYDIVIIDTPPLGLVADSLLLTKFSDVNLYIVRQYVTKRSHLDLINECMENKKINNVGIVVNDFKQKRMLFGSDGYNYGYGYGYGYGYEPKQGKSFLKRIFNF